MLAAVVLVACLHLGGTFEFGAQSQNRACQTMKAGYTQEPEAVPPPFHILIYNSAGSLTNQYRLRERLTGQSKTKGSNKFFRRVRFDLEKGTCWMFCTFAIREWKTSQIKPWFCFVVFSQAEGHSHWTTKNSSVHDSRQKGRPEERSDGADWVLFTERWHEGNLSKLHWGECARKITIKLGWCVPSVTCVLDVLLFYFPRMFWSMKRKLETAENHGKKLPCTGVHQALTRGTSNSGTGNFLLHPGLCENFEKNEWQCEKSLASCSGSLEGIQSNERWIQHSKTIDTIQ